METASLVPVLAQLNRAGYVTDFSQPGIGLDANGDGQRAAVAGFCSEVMAARLMDAVCRTDLVVVAGDPGEPASASIVLTFEDGREFTWLGRGPDPDIFVEDLSEEAFVGLMSAFYVEILDPCWGRNDLLWPTLRAAAAGVERRQESGGAAAHNDHDSVERSPGCAAGPLRGGVGGPRGTGERRRRRRAWVSASTPSTTTVAA